MNIVLYGHGGSRNHGCEAIVRSTIMLLGEQHNYILLSERPEEDIEYGLDSIATIIPSRNPLPRGILGWLYRIEMKIFRSEKIYYRNIYKSIIKRIGPCDIAIAIGGDNYCYDGMFDQFSVMNDYFRKNGIITYLWGCSIDSERLNKRLLKDLKGFSLIYTREIVTFHSLLSLGIKNVVHLPDPAFILPEVEPFFPEITNHYVGINVSPLIIKQEKVSGVVINSFIRLIKSIIEETNYDVLLIPHVVWEANDDREPLSLLFSEFFCSGRVHLVEDCNSMELKGYISKCRFFVAARTHASIAAYSNCIPTLVIGYSVKSRGIAQDLFQEDTPFVFPVSDMIDEEGLTERFHWLLENGDLISRQLSTFIPSYKESLSKITDFIQ